MRKQKKNAVRALIKNLETIDFAWCTVILYGYKFHLGKLLNQRGLPPLSLPDSKLGDNLAKPDWHHHHDHFLDSNPNIRWKETLEHEEKLGIGTREYELIKM